MFLRNNMKTGLILLSALILNLINFNYTMRLTHYQNNKLKSLVQKFKIVKNAFGLLDVQYRVTFGFRK